MADWYYAKNGQQKGPISPAELKKLATSGEIAPTDLVFQEGGTQWVEASTVKGLFPAGGAKPAPAPAPAPTPAPAPAKRDDFDLEPEPRGGSKGRDRDSGRENVRDKDRDGGRDRDRNRDRDRDDDFDAPRASGKQQGGGFMNFMMLRSFVAPTVVVVLFWLAVLIAFGVMVVGTLIGLLTMTQTNGFLPGLGLIVSSIFGPPLTVFLYRIVFEAMIVTFRMYEELTAIRKELEKARTEK
jgi:hypothetical protein